MWSVSGARYEELVRRSPENTINAEKFWTSQKVVILDDILTRLVCTTILNWSPRMAGMCFTLVAIRSVVHVVVQPFLPANLTDR